MSAHRKPAEILELSGAFKHDPQRRRGQPRPHGPIGNPPTQAPITFERAWAEIVAMVPDGVLADRDRLAVEMAAHLLVKLRREKGDMHPAKLARLAMLLRDLGLTPADAGRVSAGTSAPDDGGQWE